MFLQLSLIPKTPHTASFFGDRIVHRLPISATPQDPDIFLVKTFSSP